MGVELGFSSRHIETENRVLRRVCETKREDITGRWRKLHDKELHKYYCTNVIRAIKSRSARWARYVARMGEISIPFQSENLKGREHPGDPVIDGRIILKWTLKMGYEGADWIELAQDRD
jgi:hypothetical protein